MSKRLGGTTQFPIWTRLFIKTGSESTDDCSQEADFVRGICGAHGGYETTEVGDVRRSRGGAGCVGGQEKEWMRCFLDDLRAFGINADQWTTAAQDDGEYRKTVEQGAERFMAKLIAVEKVRADYGMQYNA